MKKTVLILGAGASADYGYPLWSQLREQMLDLDIDEFLLSEAGLDGDNYLVHKQAYNEFQELAINCPDYTLDQIVYKMDQPKAKHFKPTGHLIINISGFLLAKVEMRGLDGKWVTDFRDVLVEYLIDNVNRNNLQQNILEDLTIVSLNYDRVFEHYISCGFFETVHSHPAYSLQSPGEAKIFSRKNKLRIVKPHGYICMLSNRNNSNEHLGMLPDLELVDYTAGGTRYPGSYLSIPYRDKRIVETDAILRMGRYMYVVDERGIDDYERANRCLGRADMVFCLGLSVSGICQSSLVFRKNQKIYLSNGLKDIPQIEKQKPGPDYIPLGDTGKRLNVIDFTNRWKLICL